MGTLRVNAEGGFDSFDAGSTTAIGGSSPIGPATAT
jgi:hypothetical protein